MTINFRKRKKPIIIASILLALIGFAWWRATAPPAFADFVYKAGGEVEVLEAGRISLVKKPGGFILFSHSRREKAFTTSASVTSVILALGDQIGDENVQVSSSLATALSNGTRFIVLGASGAGGSTTLVMVKPPYEITAVDRLLGNIWSGWFDFRFGTAKKSGSVFTDFMMVKLSTKELQAIKKLRPRIKVDVEP